jgi:Flp pilus assembly protein TadD
VTGSSLQDVAEALASGDHERVLRLTGAILAEAPGNDAAHEHRARSLLAIGRLDEAERHAQDAVRLDPEEIRYRELLAEILSREGAHRDAAAEFGRLARNDPAEPTWTVAEARERIDAAQPGMGVEAARRAVKLEPRNGRAQLALSQALSRTGDARGAFQAATLATELLPGDHSAREALADAHYLAGQEAAAFNEFRALANELSGRDRDRVVSKARALYRRQAGLLGRLVAGIGPAFELAFGNGWLRIDR